MHTQHWESIDKCGYLDMYESTYAIFEQAIQVYICIRAIQLAPVITFWTSFSGEDPGWLPHANDSDKYGCSGIVVRQIREE